MSEQIQKKKEVKLVPHLALTHNELQEGAASGRNVSLLMKADAELTEDQITLLKSIVGEAEVIEKMSHNSLRKKLNEAIKAFSTDRWDWSYVEDFDETIVVFSNSDGLYSVGYSVDGTSVVLEAVAHPVNQIISYEGTSGKIILSESDDGADVNVLALVKKSFEQISNNEKLKGVYKSKLEKGKQLMEQEIQKAVQDALAPLKTDLEKSASELKTAQEALEKAAAEKKELEDKLAEIEKAQKDAKDVQRKEMLKSVIADEAQVEALFKSLEVLEDEAFEQVVKGFAGKNEQLENSDLFIQKSGSESAETSVESNLMQMLKAKYKTQE